MFIVDTHRLYPLTTLLTHKTRHAQNQKTLPTLCMPCSLTITSSHRGMTHVKMSPLDCGDSSNPDGDEVKGEVFLTSYDFDANKIRQSRAFRSRHALGMERLRKTFFEAEGSRKRLFIFDSCYSGDFPGPRYRSDEADPVQGYIKYMLDSKSTGRVALLSCLPIQKAR